MQTIDFTRIRGQGIPGQRDAFEEFVCQLARRDAVGQEAEFRRVEGSGGDGGVEAYWLHKDGTKWGYQAKYWTRTAYIDWEQIDDSVKQTLSSHPETVCYTLALPCDLTDRSGRKGKGKKGWEHWDTHRKKWEGWAKQRQLCVDYRVWPASELRSKALGHLRSGAINYWFDGTLLDDGWFADRAAVAINDLGVRYSPLAHIETQVQDCFRAFVRHDAPRQAVIRAIDSFRSRHAALKHFLDSLGDDHLASLFATLSEELYGLPDDVFSVDVASAFCWRDFKTAWLEALSRLNVSATTLRSAAEEQDATRRAIWQVDRLMEALVGLRDVLCAEPLQFSDARALLLLGSFGTGKSHAMGKILQSAIQESRAAVLFLGQQFNNANPRSQLVQFADLPTGTTWSDFLDGLNAASEAKGELGLVLIDAINEGGGIAIWPNQIAGLLTDVAQRPALRIIVSCRTEYKDRLWPTSVNVEEYELDNFTEDEFRTACVRLMDDEGIARPTSAFLPPEFYNPLILSTACRSLKAQGLSQFPGSLGGLSDFVDLYVRGVAHSVTQQYHLDGPLEAPMQRALLSLAEKMVAKTPDFVTEADAREVLHAAFGRAPPPSTDWLDVLLGSGTLRLDPDPQADAWEPWADVVRFAFQIHEQVYIARALVKLAGSSRRPFDDGEPLEFVRRDIDHTGAVGCGLPTPDWLGALMALSVLWPMQTGDEIVDVLPPSAESPRMHDVVQGRMLEGLLWRKPEQVTARTTELLQRLASLGKMYATMLKFAGIVDHPWNGFCLHEQLAAYGNIASRDEAWTAVINTSIELDATIRGHIRWTLGQLGPFANETVAESTALALTWFLTATNRSLRDWATKALVHLLRMQPAIAPALLRRFRTTDDPYVLERLLAAVYGACSTLTGEHVRVAAEAVYEHILGGGNPPQHLLARDYALGVVERASFLGVLPEQVDMEVCRSPHTTPWPLDRHTNAEVDALAASVGDEYGAIARSCTTEYGRGVGQYGDFGRYVLESHVRRFLPVGLGVQRPTTNPYNSGWDGELIGNWVAWRAYGMGWRASLFSHDRTLGEYVGRSRGKAERIGKKYQWIAMYELLGILSDHVWCKGPYDDPKTYYSAFDVEFCRDIDPTVVSHEVFARSLTESSSAGLKFAGLGDVSGQPEWPYSDESLLDLEQATTFVAEDGRPWYRLFARASEDSLGKHDAASFLSFACLSTVCIPASRLDATLVGWERRRKAAFSDLQPPNFTDNEFLYELSWRQTRDTTDEDEESTHLAADTRAAKAPDLLTTVCQYVWETGRDETLPDGVACQVLAPWVANGTGLVIDTRRPTEFRRPDHSRGFFSFHETSGGRSNSACLIEAEAFDRLMQERGLVCLWVFEGERMLSLGIRGGRRRFFSGVAWFEAGEFQCKTWWDDTL